MSLAALIIALGLLVDNAIVMSESIMVLDGPKASRVKEAAIDSANGAARRHCSSPRLTTAAAFLPIYLAQVRRSASTRRPSSRS